MIKLVENKKISAGHAKILVGLDNALFVATKIIERKLSVRKSEAFVKIFKNKNKVKGHMSKDTNILSLEREIREKIGLYASIKSKKNNSGSITFDYKSLDQLNKIIEIIKSYY